MAKALDVGFAVRTREVANGNVDNSQSQNCGRVEQLKITERIEVAKIAPPRRHALVVAALDKFCPAQRITDANIQNPAEHFREENIPQPVEKAHGIAFHRVNQPRTVDEIAEALTIGCVEAPEHFGRHGQIGIQNGQERLSRMSKPESYGVRFALSGLLQGLNLKTAAIKRCNTLDLFPSPVVRMPFHKYYFCFATQTRKTLQRVFYVAALVAGGDDAGDSRAGRSAKRAQDNDIRQAKPPRQRHQWKNSIDDVAKPQHPPRTVDGQPAADNLKARHLDDVPKIDLCHERARKLAAPDSQAVRETVQRAQIGVVKDGDDARSAR